LLGDLGANEKSVRGEDFRRGLRIDQTGVPACGLVKRFRVPERRVELADRFADGGLQHHAVAELRHVGVRREPFRDFADREIRRFRRPEVFQLQPQRLSPEPLLDDVVRLSLVVDPGWDGVPVLRAEPASSATISPI
jgi:hypothetical protein